MLTLDTVYQASFILKEVARKTDLIRAPKLFSNAEVYLKTENLQNTGSFKLRGAYFKMARLSPEEKARGIVACSAGNHAQGVALAAQRQGIDAIICVPDGAPISKVEATRSYGAKVELVRGVYDDAYKKAIS
jgi:threonine dehydratase